MPYDALVRLWNAAGPAADMDSSGQLLAWLEGPALILQTLDSLVRVDDADDPVWSAILDITRCPTYALPWLGQLVGVRLPSSLPDTVMRQKIQAEQGWQRGTVVALEAAAAPFLIPPNKVIISERTTDPYHLTITAYDSWLIPCDLAFIQANYPTLGDVKNAFATLGDFPLTNDRLAAALQAAKPAGLVLTVTINVYATLNDLIPLGTLGSLQTDFATLNNIANYNPA